MRLIGVARGRLETARRRRPAARGGAGGHAQQWLGQTKKNPHSAAHYGVYAFKPKSPLAIVDTGIDPYMGVAVWLEAHKQNEFKYRPAQDRTAVGRFGEMTAAGSRCWCRSSSF